MFENVSTFTQHEWAKGLDLGTDLTLIHAQSKIDVHGVCWKVHVHRFHESSSSTGQGKKGVLKLRNQKVTGLF